SVLRQLPGVEKIVSDQYHFRFFRRFQSVSADRLERQSGMAGGVLPERNMATVYGHGHRLPRSQFHLLTSVLFQRDQQCDTGGTVWFDHIAERLGIRQFLVVDNNLYAHPAGLPELVVDNGRAIQLVQRRSERIRRKCADDFHQLFVRAGRHANLPECRARRLSSGKGTEWAVPRRRWAQGATNLDGGTITASGISNGKVLGWGNLQWTPRFNGLGDGIYNLI